MTIAAIEMSDEDGDQQKNQDKGQDYEDIIDQLGAFGHWQRVIFILISLADVHGAFAMLLPVFVGATPRWSCDRLNGHQRNGTSELNLTSEQCSFNGTECADMRYQDDFTSIVSQWNLVCERDYISDMMSSIQMGGLLLGACVFSQLSDLIGRKKSYFMAFFFLVGPGFVTGFSNSWQMYAVCRFLVGIGYGGSMVVGCVYPIEFVGRRWRNFCGTIGFWAIGQAILALIAYFIRDWRHLAMATSISAAPYYLLCWIIPESPRWLIQQGRFEEAEEILTNIARRNKKPPPSIRQLSIFAEINQKKDLLLRKYTYLDLFRRRQYMKTTVINLLIWFTTFVCYYEILYNLKHLSGDRYVNILLSGLVDLTAMISVILVLNWLGRRKSLAMYVSIVVVSLLSMLITVVTGNAMSKATVILVFALLGKSAALGSTYCIQIFSAELFPTAIRNLGVGTGAMAARVGGIVAPQLVYLGTISSAAPYIICSVLSIMVLSLVFFLPETNGQPLEDTFDMRQKPSSEGEGNADQVQEKL